MCGVVGYWNKNGEEADENILKKMSHRLTHRGPDDSGTFKKGSLGLGHTRLTILDLSKNGHQPFVTSDGNAVLSYNGEIYNFRELRHQLKKENVTFKSTTDTEVLLYALYHWGPEKAVLKLDGMFAFAYFDFRDNSLWLVRDRAGIKSLYWVEKGNLNVFASEMKALFDHPEIVCRPDMHALSTQVLMGRLDGDWTPFENIKSVLPGTIIKITRSQNRVITYFDILRDVNVDRILDSASTPFEDKLRSFEQIFEQSVQSHLVSDAPLATMCSGGLDSSLIAAIGKELKPDMEGYVADVENAPFPEVQRAETVCKHIGMHLNKIKVSQETFLRSWPKAVYHNDQPNYYPQNIIYKSVCSAAHKDGFKVLLAGDGSDELFGGYDWHVSSYHMWKKRRIHSKFIPNNRLFKKLGDYLRLLAPIDLALLAEKPFTPLSRTNIKESFSSQARMSVIDGLQRSVRAENLFKKLEKVVPVEDRAFLARGLDDFYIHLRTLLRSNDKMAMSVSVEARVPFLSNQLIDFAFHLNPQSKFNQNKTKYIVKKAAEKKLPHAIVHAKKVGFGFSAAMWGKGVDFLRGGMVPELFKWGEKEAENIYEDLRSDRSIIFSLLSIELWAQLFLNHQSPEDLSEILLAKLR